MVAWYVVITKGVDFGGQLGAAPPIIEKCPCIYHFLPPFAPNILVCPPNISDKSTPVVITMTYPIHSD